MKRIFRTFTALSLVLFLSVTMMGAFVSAESEPVESVAVTDESTVMSSDSTFDRESDIVDVSKAEDGDIAEVDDTVTATDDVVEAAALQTVTREPSAAIFGGDLPSGVIGEPYSAQAIIFDDEGYTRILTITDGELPVGLTLNNDGTITGTPTEGTWTWLSVTVSWADMDKTGKQRPSDV